MCRWTVGVSRLVTSAERSRSSHSGPPLSRSDARNRVFGRDSQPMAPWVIEATSLPEGFVEFCGSWVDRVWPSLNWRGRRQTFYFSLLSLGRFRLRPRKALGIRFKLRPCWLRFGRNRPHPEQKINRSAGRIGRVAPASNDSGRFQGPQAKLHHSAPDSQVDSQRCVAGPAGRFSLGVIQQDANEPVKAIGELDVERVIVPHGRETSSQVAASDARTLSGPALTRRGRRDILNGHERFPMKQE